ncbi:MAG TPA: MgtC/SapB family protein [bacterium]|nr:MgtC/SapB family protein [bacterium]
MSVVTDNYVLLILQLLLAAFLGGLIGLEREKEQRPAGVRTYVVTALGAYIFTLLSYIAATNADGQLINDPTRISAQIVTGIGFLGAGVIMKKDNHVEGITTAAGLWVTAAIGMAVGLHQYLLAVTATAITLIVLLALRFHDK